MSAVVATAEQAGKRPQREARRRTDGGRPEGGKRRLRPSFACPSVGRSVGRLRYVGLISDARSFFLSPFPSLGGGRHDETTGGEPGLREWAEGRARLRDSTITLQVQIMGRVSSVRCQRRDCPPKARRVVDAAEAGLDASAEG